MKKRETTAAAVQGSWRPTLPGDNAINVPQQQQRQGERVTITNASNEAVPVPIAVILLIVYLALSFLIAYFGGEAAGASIPVRMVVGGVLATTMAFATMAFVTGDAMGMWESVQTGRTERRWAEVEEARIDAIRAITLKQLDNDSQNSKQNHIERTTQIEADKQMQIGYIDASREQPTGDTWTPAKPTPAVVAVRAFLSKCYTADGYNIPDYVASTDGMLTRAPWNHQWRGQPWKDDAKDLIEQYALRRQGNISYLLYDNNHDAQAALPRFDGVR